LLTGEKIPDPEQLYTLLGKQALSRCADTLSLGSVGAGTGATTANLKGGLGSASLVLPNEATVGALAVVNAHGSAVHPENGRFWAAPYEIDNEFGGFGAPATYPTLQIPVSEKSAAFAAGSNTTIAIVATDVDIDKAQLLRMATAAHDGIARALVPSHTLLDGDLVFAVSTGRRPLHDALEDAVLLGHAAALCLTRAIARGVYAATAHGGDALATWSERWLARM
jgi:D-aminopeptidase